MPNSLDISKRAELVRFGFPQSRSRDYDMMLSGFDDHRVKLLLHTDNPQQVPQFYMRVGNPMQIDNAEADYLVRKMLAGYYPWPVDECLEHEFEGKDKRKVFGCRWCRERQTSSGSPGDVAGATPEQVKEAVSPESSASQTPATPPLVTLEDVVCTECGWIAEPVNKAGKTRTAGHRKSALSMHKRTAHRKDGVPA